MGEYAAYVAFGRAMGYMTDPSDSSRAGWIDVHGAGAQRSQSWQSCGFSDRTRASGRCDSDGTFIKRISNHNFWDLKNMMKQFDVFIEKDSESYFVASVPALRGCHTQAKSLYVLMERIRESIELCLEVQGEIPEPLDFVGIQRISVAA